MQKTTNYGLKKPEGTDPVDVRDFNDNADILDGELKKRPESTGKAGDMTAEFVQAASRSNLLSGETIKTSFGKIMKFFTDLKAVAFSGSAADLSTDVSHRLVSDTEKNGWNAKAGTNTATQNANGLMSAADKKKLDGVAAFKGATASAAGGAGLVPAPAAGGQTKYLRADGTWQIPPDTNTWRGIQNNLTSASITDSLSAAQGKALDEKIRQLNTNLTLKTYVLNETFGIILMITGGIFRIRITKTWLSAATNISIPVCDLKQYGIDIHYPIYKVAFTNLGKVYITSDNGILKVSFMDNNVAPGSWFYLDETFLV